MENFAEGLILSILSRRIFLSNYIMPRKRTRRKMQGAGIKQVLQKVHDFVKKHKLVSKALAAVTPFAGSFAPLASGASAGASALGYGRRRRRRVGRPRKRK